MDETARGPAASASALIGAKQRELQELFEQRLQALQSLVAQRDADLQQERQNFVTLQEDFRYNLSLIEDRDAELEKYDAMAEELRRLVRERDGAISNLRAAAAAQEGMVKEIRLRMAEMEADYQRQLQDCRATAQRQVQQAERAQRDKENEQAIGWRELQRQVRAKEEEWETQRVELLRSCDDRLQSQDHAAKRREAELESELHQLTGRLREERANAQTLAKQCEQLNAARADLERSASDAVRTAQAAAEGLQADLDQARAERDAAVAEVEAEGRRHAAALDAVRDSFEAHLQEIKAETEAREQLLHAELERERQRAHEAVTQETLRLQTAAQQAEAAHQRDAEAIAELRGRLLAASEELVGLRVVHARHGVQTQHGEEEARALRGQVAELERQLALLREEVGALRAQVQVLTAQGAEATTLLSRLDEEHRARSLQETHALTSALQVAKHEAEQALRQRDGHIAVLEDEVVALRRAATDAKSLEDKRPDPTTSVPPHGRQTLQARRSSLAASLESDFAPVDVPPLSPFLRRLDAVPSPFGPPPQPPAAPSGPAAPPPDHIAALLRDNAELQAALAELQRRAVVLERTALEKDKQLLRARLKRDREGPLVDRDEGLRQLGAELLAMRDRLSPPPDAEAVPRRKYAKLAKYARGLETENTALREKLKDAMEDMKRLINERAKLIDISNMLRCDLQRAMGQTAASPAPPYSPPPIPIPTMEANIRRLVEENAVMKAELMRTRQALSVQDPGGGGGTSSSAESPGDGRRGHPMVVRGRHVSLERPPPPPPSGPSNPTQQPDPHVRRRGHSAVRNYSAP
jgi:hypothetical protein